MQEKASCQAAHGVRSAIEPTNHSSRAEIRQHSATRACLTPRTGGPRMGDSVRGDITGGYWTVASPPPIYIAAAG
eukprot:scaffold6976_cov118-Isochrysis_galbana.AAC.4